MRIRASLICGCLVVSVWLMASSVLAQAPTPPAPGAGTSPLTSDVLGQLGAGAEEAGLTAPGLEPADPRVVIAEVLQVLLGLYGIAFVILMFIAGYWLITAHGEEGKIEKAYTTIRGAIIGLIIVLSAYSVAFFVARNIKDVADNTVQEKYLD